MKLKLDLEKTKIYKKVIENNYREGPRGHIKTDGLDGCNAILLVANALSNNAKQARNCSKLSHFFTGLLKAWAHCKDSQQLFRIKEKRKEKGCVKVSSSASDSDVPETESLSASRKDKPLNCP